MAHSVYEKRQLQKQWRRTVVSDIEYIAIINDPERPRNYFENLCSLIRIGKFSIQIRTDETEIAGYNFSGHVKIKKTGEVFLPIGLQSKTD